MRSSLRLLFIIYWISFIGPLLAATNVFLTEVPDYEWWCGCFGTATGNLMGYWDRHGFPNFYTGPTAGGVAPLDSFGAHVGIRSLWASKAGFDGRPADQYGHVDDYYIDYESTAPDPYLTAGRPEHPPDCLGDFTGLSQNKWPNLNGECAGNIDGFSFVFWDPTGAKRVNYVPSPQGGQPITDIPSGLMAWTQYRGEACAVFSQLTDFNPNVAPGQGFSFADLTAEINAGYPVLLFMQKFDRNSRTHGLMPNANPNIHALLAYGYYVSDSGAQYVHYRDSWAGGDYRFSPWNASEWVPNLPVRGVIGYHPLPKIQQVTANLGQITVTWSGPAAIMYDAAQYQTINLHWYMVEKSTALSPGQFSAVGPATPEHTVTFAAPTDQTMFLRVRLAQTGEHP